MADADPWAGMVDPRAALKAAREAAKTLADFSSQPPMTCESEYYCKSETYDDFSNFRNFSSPPRGLSHSSEEKPKDREIFTSSLISEGCEFSASPGGLLEPDRDSSGARGPAKVANPLKYGITHSDISTIALATSCETLAATNTVPSPTAHLHGPQVWCEGVARLDLWTPPCPGFRSGEWSAIVRVIQHFMEHYAGAAEHFGWTAIDLFAVHSIVGAVRVDCCGALMLPASSTVTEISGQDITFGAVTYQRRLMLHTVLAWDFGGTL